MCTHQMILASDSQACGMDQHYYKVTGGYQLFGLDMSQAVVYPAGRQHLQYNPTCKVWVMMHRANIVKRLHALSGFVCRLYVYSRY